jgi:hypothetical protein
MVIRTPSSATVNGWCVALVSRNRINSAIAKETVVRAAIRSRSNPGSEPIAQFCARSYSAVARSNTRDQPLLCGMLVYRDLTLA